MSAELHFEEFIVRLAAASPQAWTELDIEEFIVGLAAARPQAWAELDNRCQRREITDDSGIAFKQEVNRKYEADRENNSYRLLDAMTMLYGIGCGVDQGAAYVLIDQVSEKKWPCALYYKGICLEQGRGIEVDIAAAKAAYLEAISLNWEAAAVALAKLHYRTANATHTAIVSDIKKLKDPAKALFAIAKTCLEILVDEKATQEALAWYEQAAALNHTEACYQYALLADSIDADQATQAKAIRFLQQAVGANHLRAIVQYGQYWVSQKCYEEAAIQFHRACLRDDPMAHIHMGELSKLGQGVPKDHSLALHHYFQAYLQLKDHTLLKEFSVKDTVESQAYRLVIHMLGIGCEVNHDIAGRLTSEPNAELILHVISILSRHKHLVTEHKEGVHQLYLMLFCTDIAFDFNQLKSEFHEPLFGSFIQYCELHIKLSTECYPTCFQCLYYMKQMGIKGAYKAWSTTLEDIIDKIGTTLSSTTDEEVIERNHALLIQLFREHQLERALHVFRKSRTRQSELLLDRCKEGDREAIEQLKDQSEHSPEAKVAFAQYRLYLAETRTKKRKRRRAKAFKALREAADASHHYGKAYFHKAICLKEGIGTEPDAALAVHALYSSATYDPDLKKDVKINLSSYHNDETVDIAIAARIYTVLLEPAHRTYERSKDLAGAWHQSADKCISVLKEGFESGLIELDKSIALASALISKTSANSEKIKIDGILRSACIKKLEQRQGNILDYDFDWIYCMSPKALIHFADYVCSNQTTYILEIRALFALLAQQVAQKSKLLTETISGRVEQYSAVDGTLMDQLQQRLSECSAARNPRSSRTRAASEGAISRRSHGSSGSTRRHQTTRSEKTSGSSRSSHSEHAGSARRARSRNGSERSSHTIGRSHTSGSLGSKRHSGKGSNRRRVELGMFDPPPAHAGAALPPPSTLGDESSFPSPPAIEVGSVLLLPPAIGSVPDLPPPPALGSVPALSPPPGLDLGAAIGDLGLFAGGVPQPPPGASQHGQDMMADILSGAF